MEIYKEILDQLKKEYSDGATYQEMSSKYGVSYQYLRELIHGIKKTDRMSLGVFFKLFPHAQINLNAGDHINGSATSHYGPAVGNNFGGKVFMQQPAAFDEIITAVMASDLDSDAKVKVFNIVNKIKQGE